MDISARLQCFEKGFSAYTGDDPLDPWGKFVDYLEQRIPEGDLSQVLDKLVQRFLNDERYSDDVRYVNYCIRCASFYPDPIALYTHVYSRGVGHRHAGLYVAWAQQLERRAMLEQADAVYQKAMKNQAQPADTILNEYREFQTRTKHQTSVSESRSPLQNSQLANQMTSHREHHNKAPVECSVKPPIVETIITVSRSETSGASQGSNVHFVSEYLKEELLCEGSELCFEEVRAAKYFRQVQVQQQAQTSKGVFVKDGRSREKNKFLDLTQKVGEMADSLTLQTAEVVTSAAFNVNSIEPAVLHEAPAVAPVDHQEWGKITSDPARRPVLPVLPDSSVPLPAQQMAPSPQEGSSTAENVLLHEDPEIRAAAQDEPHPPQPGDRLNLSQEGTCNQSHVTPNTSLGLVQATPSRVLPSPTVNTREALNVIMDMFQAPTLLGDPFSSAPLEPPSDMEAEPAAPHHGGVCSSARPPAAAAFTIFQDDKEKSSAAAPHPALGGKPVRPLAEIQLASKPNETPPELAPDESTMWGARYNSLAACPNSTSDFAMLAQFVSTPFACKTPHSSSFFQAEENGGGDADDDASMRRPPKKLSPIMEQSPADETAVNQLAPPCHSLETFVGEGSTSSTTTLQPPPPPVLSFRDQTICARTALNPDREQPPKPETLSSGQSELFRVLEDAVQDPVCDVSVGPEGTLQPDWMHISSPEAPPETDLDAFLSPDRGRCLDVSMNSRPGSPPLLSNPWDDQLISRLLSALTPPLTSHPHCITWSCTTPAISAKKTITMGSVCLRVDCLLGQGAFASVYQATNPVSAERMVLKVQKPANPWEFYIHTQLDARLQPATRHLFSSVRSAHLFKDGSVLVAELHQYGTLLNAVNIYKSLSEKVMPQPLVMHFAICILSMVEQLHASSIIHADIKPDNFLLGERFLENQRFEPENLDHGLVLIDFGQSVDMALLPEGVAFTASSRTSGFQCTEMLSGRPWNYQTDYFGVAGTVHCMLFGTYMQVTNEGGVWKTNGAFRRFAHSELWQEFFHVLLNIPGCSSLPSLARLRGQLALVLQQSCSHSKLGSLRSRLLVQLLERRKAAAR